MLNRIRRQAGSWVVKILLLLLVASFAIWGIGDIFYGGGQNPVVAEVGDSEILASDLGNEFSRVLDNLQRRLGTNIDREQAIQLGLMQQALQDLVARRLVDLRAREMGLTVSDQTLRQMIVDNPVFQTAGRFDRTRFEQILLASGMTEQSYLAALRQDVLRGTLTDSLAAPALAPEALVDALYRHRNQERRGRMLVVPTDSIRDLPEPTDDQLAAFHAANEQRFTTPEFRALSFITLAPDDLLEEVDVAEEEIEAAYEQRLDQYREPELRTVEQLLARDEAGLREAAQRVSEGASLGDAAAAVEGIEFTDLGEVSEGQLPAELEDAIFAMSEGDVSEPVRSPFGWHLFRIVEVEPEEVTPLAEVHDALAQELALEEASERLPGLANQLDDELAAGATLEEAAQTLGLAVKKVAAVDASGKAPDGERPAALPAPATFLDTALTTPAGETSLLEEGEDGSYFVLRVDQVTPPRLKPVTEVRAELVAAWQAEERQKRARERAEQLLGRLNEGVALERVARDAGLELVTIEPVKRTGGGPQSLSPAVVSALFATRPGAFAGEVAEVSNGFAVVTTDEIIEATPADDPAATEQLEAALEAEIQSDILSQFGEALRRDYPVSIDTNEVARLSGAAGAGGLF